ncbi:hypothetical protein KM043_012293 [Ampulex compressa]|nr:hypothetical protein KM043_012293 [Ampulex compressa]
MKFGRSRGEGRDLSGSAEEQRADAGPRAPREKVGTPSFWAVGDRGGGHHLGVYRPGRRKRRAGEAERPRRRSRSACPAPFRGIGFRIVLGRSRRGQRRRTVFAPAAARDAVVGTSEDPLFGSFHHRLSADPTVDVEASKSRAASRGLGRESAEVRDRDPRVDEGIGRVSGSTDGRIGGEGSPFWSRRGAESAAGIPSRGNVIAPLWAHTDTARRTRGEQARTHGAHSRPRRSGTPRARSSSRSSAVERSMSGGGATPCRLPRALRPRVGRLRFQATARERRTYPPMINFAGDYRAKIRRRSPDR